MDHYKVSYWILIQILLLVLLQTSHSKDTMLDRLLNLQNKEQGYLIPLQVYDQLPLHQVLQLVILFVNFLRILTSNSM